METRIDEECVHPTVCCRPGYLAWDEDDLEYTTRNVKEETY